ncbi:liver carboxylesterase 1-like [Phascolarctos cinereus]|uniref:Carboxylic ester hydrolase n=1 Tax=Phascolarctos cinereus TaxID=38626 RepID=A0A6P5K7J1_PHACI|nr:liver carboxylesterase 1-like [Phascolarctos cinereus]
MWQRTVLNNIWLISLLLCSIIVFITQGQQHPSMLVVDTEYGKVQGKEVRLQGFDIPVRVFLGVPFAKPPLGPLRFHPPQPPEPWEYVKNTTTYPPLCPQDIVVSKKLSSLFSIRNETFSMTSSEDCLYLNIYSPSDLAMKTKLPVMVWIHGGGLMMGEASTYDGLALSAFENVVVVSIQYRLGILGFFSTGDEHARGNWGFLDQVAALHWVQKNIGNFGGDPSLVTIFGESAGGFSVSALMLSPLTKNLFHRAISQSGVLFMESLFSSNIKPAAEKIATFAGCKTTTSAVMVHCMRQKTEKEILNTTQNMDLFHLDFLGDPTEKFLFLPAVVDGVFFPRSPKELLAEKQFKHIPYIMGITNHEFGWFLPNILGYPISEEGLEQAKATELLWHSYPLLKIPKVLTPMITEEYLGGTSDPVKKKSLFLEMLGDLTFWIPTVILGRLNRDSGEPTYLYEFQHRSSVWGDLKPATVKADHADDIFSVFGSPFLRNGSPKEEKQLSRMVMKYWANFARNGNPNGEGLPKWPRYDHNEEYFHINITPKAAKKQKEKEVAFLTDLLTKEAAEVKIEHTEL